MDGITPGRPNRPIHPHQNAQTPQQASVKSAPEQDHNTHKLTIRLKAPKIHKNLLKKIKNFKYIESNGQLSLRFSAGLMALLVMLSIGFEIYDGRFAATKYELSPKAEQLLGASNGLYAQKLVYDAKNQTYSYNEGFQPIGGDVAGLTSGPKFTAVASTDPKKGMTINDSVNSIGVSLVPKYGLEAPTKKDNRLIYPITGLDAAKVDTLKAGSVKEDIILEKFQHKSMELQYQLKLADGTEARMESDGSIGIYGVTSALLGNVTASSESDQALLKKARDNGQKNQLLFTIPAPVVIDASKRVSPTAKAQYILQNNVLTVRAENLDKAKFPLSIDPTVYIETAAKLMKGNNETNVDFDVTNELIQKGKTTGARINSWLATGSLNTSVWDASTVAAGGYVYSIGGQEVYKNVYTSAGATNFVVPAGVTSVTVKMWGAGGGEGGGGSTGTGAAGGGGGYVTGTYTVTPGETLPVYVGGAGSGGAYTANGGGGGAGGGYSSFYRSSTPLAIAAGGGGGGGGRAASNGGVGGAGGATTGIAGTASGVALAGGGGTPSAGGGAGTGGSVAGLAGSSLTGGRGGNTGGVVGGLATGGAGGLQSTTRGGGGGGGAGYFGGGGGSQSSSATGGGGGGGGSSYTDAGATSVTNSAGSGTAAGNNSDTDRNGGGTGATGGAVAAAGTAGSNGTVVISYTVSGNSTAPSAKVSWSKFNSSTKALTNPNPGNGTCSGWCTDTAYNLPDTRIGAATVAYNGFLYVIGGKSANCTVGNGTGTSGICKTVYIAKIGANGEPQKWHPTGGTPDYWYRDTDLNGSVERAYLSAAAYNNRIYVLGGQTSAAAGGVTTVEYASLNPTGTISTWSAGTSLPAGAGKQMQTVQIYNDVMYTIGGFEGVQTSSGNLRAAVYYNKISTTGALNTWTATTSFTTARSTYGGVNTAIWGGYIYIGGGCTAVNASGYCTTIASDMQLASINADGSLAEFNAILGITNSRIGYSMIAWQGGLYRMGGCAAQNASTGVCDTTLISTDYGVVNQDGDASTVAASVSSGTAPCSGGSPYGCDLPSASVGNVLNTTLIMNGFLYIMGGCTNNACTTESTGVVYTTIASDGTLTKPATCTGGTFTDSYCVSPNSLPNAIGAGAPAIFNGRIYIVGGFPTGTNITYTTVANDGSISAWTATTLASVGATTVSYAYAYARANPTLAATFPGNFYIFGGCTSSTSVSCTTYTENVYKCSINTAGAISACSTTGQLNIGTVNSSTTLGTGAGLGAAAGTVYANYIYLIGGLGGGLSDLDTIRYAKFDTSNNVVNALTGVITGGWTEDRVNVTVIGRRRGAAFGYNGYLYAVGGYDATAGVLADIEFAKINVSTGAWSAFTVSAVSINNRWGLSVPVSNSYAYVIGGCTAGAAPSSCTTRTNTVQTFQIYNNDSGAAKSYTAASDDTFATNTDRWGASATVLNGYVYVAGGCTSTTDCTTAVSDVQYSPISASDGSLGTWSTATNGLTAVRAWGKLVTVGGSLYYLGGQDSTATNEQSTIYYVSTFSSGDITAAWSTASGGIGDLAGAPVAQARTKFGVAVWNDRIYIVGGLDGSAAVTSTVYVSPQQSAGGDIAADSWTSSTAFNVARYGSAVTAYANNLYLFGGNNGTNYLNDSQFAQIAANGTVGSWTYSTSLPGYLSQAEAFAANGYMYVVGGRSATSSCPPNTLVTPISANTTIASGNNPTGVGEWFETNVKYTGGRYGAAVAYSQGKAYVMGGGCSAPQGPTYSTGTIAQTTTTITGTGTTWTDNFIGQTITYQDASTATIIGVTDTTHLVVSVSKTVTAGTTYSIASVRHSYAVLKSQPQVAKYSRMIDTDTDVFPTKWLMNGLDNSIGARWQMKYRSSTASAAAWGQETNFGTVTLGDTATFNPLNSGGSNTSFARYYYMSVSIDSSQTFGYPEDVNRGPTIYDLSLFFTADPSKRLIHGKTFVGGEQQPLDTPCNAANPNCL